MERQRTELLVGFKNTMINMVLNIIEFIKSNELTITSNKSTNHRFPSRDDQSYIISQEDTDKRAVNEQPVISKSEKEADRQFNLRKQSSFE